LDVGCGSCPYFLENIDFKEKTGLDPVVDTTVKYNNLRLFKQAFVCQKLPFNDKYFNAVSLLAVAEHLYEADDRLLFKEVYRVLDKNGVFVLTTPTPWTDQLLKILASINVVSKEEIAEHKILLPISLLKSMLIDASFLEDQITYGYFELGMNQWIRVIKTV
jgi:SAM-dependent methyltransferase